VATRDRQTDRPPAPPDHGSASPRRSPRAAPGAPGRVGSDSGAGGGRSAPARARPAAPGRDTARAPARSVSRPAAATPAEPAGEPFVLDENDRYARLRLISWWSQERLARSRVLVVGVGALGNEVIKNLALLGVGHVWIIDFDTVEDTNLTRSVLFRASDAGTLKTEAAAAMVRELNPDVKVRAINGDIIMDVGLGLFQEMDVVIGCLDNREARLWVNRCCWKVSTPWVDGGIQEISGVVKVFRPPHGACYECGMSEMDYKLINLKYSCPLLKREDIIQGKVPTAPTISSIIAGLETQEALKILHGMEVASGVGMVFSGETNNFYTTRFQTKKDCLSHETYPEAVSVPLAAEDTTLAAFFDAVRRSLPGAPEGRAGASGAGPGSLRIHLDRDLLVSLSCPRCDIRREVLAPVSRVSLEEGKCEECGEVCQTDIVYDVGLEDRFEGKTLYQLGIPPFDIVKVASGDAVGFFRLDGDRERALA
jgi:adenylyltransferase/sulfurtransferase